MSMTFFHQRWFKLFKFGIQTLAISLQFSCVNKALQASFFNPKAIYFTTSASVSLISVFLAPDA